MRVRGTSAERADQLQRSGRSFPTSSRSIFSSVGVRSVLPSSCRRAQPFTISCNFCWLNPGLPLVAAYSTTRRRQRSRSSIAAHSPPPMPPQAAKGHVRGTPGSLAGARQSGDLSSTGAPEALARYGPSRSVTTTRRVATRFQWSNSYALARLAPPEVHPRP